MAALVRLDLLDVLGPTGGRIVSSRKKCTQTFQNNQA